MTTAVSYADFSPSCCQSSTRDLIDTIPADWHIVLPLLLLPTLVLNSSLLSFSFTHSFFCSVFDFDCCTTLLPFLCAFLFIALPRLSLKACPQPLQPTCPFLFTPCKLSNPACFTSPSTLSVLPSKFCSASITKIFLDPM